MPDAVTPLQRYLRVQRVTDRELAAILRDAARDGEALVKALAPRDGLSAAVSRAQYARVVLALRREQARLWGSVTVALQAGLERAAIAAADAENATNRGLFGAKRGPTVRDLEKAQEQQALATVRAYMGRTEEGISLSAQVYKTRQLTTGMVDREVGRSILLGEGWSQMAARVKDMIRPDTRGGISYAAKRLGRTELNNAFHRVQIDQRSDSPFAEGFQWHTSGSHPRPDECDDLAKARSGRRGEAGVYPVGSVPRKPHPQCLCYLTTIVVSDEEFVRTLARGGYDEYLNRKTGRSFR